MKTTKKKVDNFKLFFIYSYLKYATKKVQLLEVSLLGRDDWVVGDEEVVDPGVGDQVGLELVQLHGEGIAAGLSVTK